MKNESSHILSLYEWLTTSFFFWIFLALVEAATQIIGKVIPPPLGSGMFPTRIDAYYVIAALSLYALLSIPAGIVLFGAEKIFIYCKSRLQKTATINTANRMDLYLSFAWGLLLFKWISNLMPYLIHSERLPNSPYLLIVPLLALYLWISRHAKRTPRYYTLQWIAIFSGTFLLSKRAYDVFISSATGVPLKTILFIAVFCVCLLLAMIFFSLMQNIIANHIRPGALYAAIFIIGIFTGFFFTLNKFQPQRYSISPPVDRSTINSNEGKNVIILLVDCLRADHLGCYGYGRNTSPFLDRMAQKAVIFENCIAQSSWTIPSVSSIFTGVYPMQHGMNKLGTVIPQNLHTLQELLAKQGFSTAAFITNDYLDSKYGYAKGFNTYVDHYLHQEFKDYVSSRLFFFNALRYFKSCLLYPISPDQGTARWWSIGFAPFNHQKISAENVTSDVLQWIKANHNHPFYIYVHYMDVHCPYDAWYPPFDSKTYAHQNTKDQLLNIYDGRIVYIDKQIHRIWESLKNMGILNKTLFIVTADHGEEIYDHGGTGHCTTLYEELIRVPLLVFDPLLKQSPKRIERQIQLIDVPVTVLDFLNIKAPGQMVGQSLLPLINAPLQSVPSYAISYTTRGRKSLKTKEGQKLWKKNIWNQRIILQSYRLDNKWKIIIGDDGRAELFNLGNDKTEHKNMRKQKQHIFNQLKQKLIEESSKLRVFTPKENKHGISPDTRNKLRALGYL